MPAPLRLGVVLYRNSSDELERLARSLRAARAEPGSPSFEVTWLDNSPGDGLRRTVADLGFPDGYAHAGGNLGFGSAHDRLMAEAFADPSVEHYVCVNPDATLHPRCLAELAAEAARHARPGLIEARQFPDEHPKPYDPRTHETPWCSGCLLLVTRALYQAIGGFDERFFMYCEDVDLSWRARAAGFTVALAPRALVHHVGTGRSRSHQMELLMLRSGVLLGRKYGDDAFVRECEGGLRARGERPPQGSGPEASAAERAAADFSHGFSFAEVRW